MSAWSPPHGEPDLEVGLASIDMARIRAWRLNRVRSVMDRFDLDGIAAFEYANCRYIADLRPLWAPNFVLRQAVLIARGSDDVIVLVHQDDAPHRRQLMRWLEPDRIREFPTAAFIEFPAARRGETDHHRLRRTRFSVGQDRHRPHHGDGACATCRPRCRVRTSWTSGPR